MCGIAGAVGAIDAASIGRLEVALSRLTHRGPDGCGVHRGPNALLGMRRLAIIDVTGGNQPIYNEDKSVAVVCNGEIYNYPEEMARLAARGHRFQSGSDVNTIVHGYEDEGLEVVHRLRGMFAIALWDEPRQRLVLWRDRVGKKPLFYHFGGGVLSFGSELPAVMALLGSRPGYRADAIATYLRYGYIPAPATGYREVQALEPGSVLVFEVGGAPVVRRYWRRGRGSRHPVPTSREEAVEAIDAALVDATRIRLRSDVPVGLFLSGGVDSGLVASSAVRAGATGLKAFTVSVPDRELDESDAALLTARRLGLSVERIELDFAPRDLVQRIATAFGQPFADSSAVPSYAVSAAARRHRTVVLNGDGGDELFAGYRRYQMAGWSGLGNAVGALARPASVAMARLLGAVGRRSALGFAGRALRGFGCRPEERFGVWTTDLFDGPSLRRCFPGLPPAFEPPGFPPPYGDLREMLTADFEWLLPADLLVKMDIATMANSLEARSPLLDAELAELVWSLPDQWLTPSRETKPLLRTLAERHLPAEIARAPKRGFEVPVARWLGGDLKEMVADVLLATDTRLLEWADPGPLREFVTGGGRVAGNRPQMQWALLMLELFLRGAEG